MPTFGIKLVELILQWAFIMNDIIIVFSLGYSFVLKLQD